MVGKTEQLRVKALLTEAITVLCKNGLQYRRNFTVEGLLGITLDNEDVFLININEIVGDSQDNSWDVKPVLSTANGKTTPVAITNQEVIVTPSPTRRKRRRSRDSTSPSPRKRASEVPKTFDNAEERNKELVTFPNTEERNDEPVIFIKEEQESDNEASDIQITSEWDASTASISAHQLTGSGDDSTLNVDGFLPDDAFEASGGLSLDASQCAELLKGTGPMPTGVAGSPGCSSWDSTMPAPVITAVNDGLQPQKIMYACPVCQKSYTELHNCRRHILSLHFGRRDWMCFECAKSYARKEDLRKHALRVHGYEIPVNIKRKTIKEELK